MTEELNLDIVRIAAEAGAKAAMDTLKSERQRERREMVDRRLRNTKLLLRNYRLFRSYVKNAVYEIKDCESPMDILNDLMMPGCDGTLFVESIKKSVARTSVIVEHIETMLGLYRAYCYQCNNPEDERRWRVVNALFLSDKEGRTVVEIAKIEDVGERTIYRDVDIACERIAALMFGVDGLVKK
jgi:hypothetical protein